MPYVAGDDHQSQLIFAGLYSKYRVRIQDSCLAGSCPSYNNNLPHYVFWRCLMFSKSIIPWTYAPVETLYGQISARGAPFPKQGKPGRSTGLDSSFGLLPVVWSWCHVGASPLRLRSALPCHHLPLLYELPQWQPSLKVVLIQFTLSSSIGNEGTISPSPFQELLFCAC